MFIIYNEYTVAHENIRTIVETFHERIMYLVRNVLNFH